MSLLATAIAAIAGASAFEAIRFPAGALIGAMAGVAALNLMGGGAATLGGPARFAILAGLGWIVGQQFDRDTLASLRAIAVPAALVVLVLLAFGGAVAWVLFRLGALDAPTAFLAASPGGLSQMAALGSDTGANLPLVVAVHLLRVLAIFAVTPLVLVWLDRR